MNRFKQSLRSATSTTLGRLYLGLLIISALWGFTACSETPTLKPQIILQLTSESTTPEVFAVWIHRDGTKTPSLHDVATYGSPEGKGFVRTWLLDAEGPSNERVVFKAVAENGQVVALGHAEIDFRTPGLVSIALRTLDANCDPDADGYVAASCLRSFEQALILFDHEPNNPDAYPGADEVCDLVDNDGNSQVDEVGCDTLSDITVSPLGLTPAFAPHITSYTVSTTLLNSKLTLKATASHPEATLTVDGIESKSGEEHVMYLQPGTRKLPITVTSISGSVRTYEISLKMEAETTSLVPKEANEYESFGVSMAIAQGRLLVGAPGNGACSSEDPQGLLCPNAGAVYVLQPFNGSFKPIWNNQPTVLKPENDSTGALFGSAIASDDATVVIGAVGEITCAEPGVQETCESTGAAYIFQYSSGHWLPQAHLIPSNAGGATFGYSVAISGNTVVVGAPNEKSCAIGVNGSSDDECLQAGAAYVFEREDGLSWKLKAYLKAHNTDASDRFGSAVAIRDNLIAIGATGESSCGTNDWSSNLCPESGATYLFQRLDGVWSYKQTLKAALPRPQDAFGNAIQLREQELLIGAYGEAGCSTSADSDDFACDHAGAVFVFEADGGGWSESQRVKAPIPNTDDRFGTSISIENDVLLIGASNEAGCGNNINPTDEPNEECPTAGAAYLYRRSNGLWEPLIHLKANPASPGAYFGGSVLIDNERLFVGAPVEFTCDDADPAECLYSGSIYIYE